MSHLADDSSSGDVDLLVFLPLVALVCLHLKSTSVHIFSCSIPPRLRGGHGNLKLLTERKLPVAV